MLKPTDAENQADVVCSSEPNTSVARLPVGIIYLSVETAVDTFTGCWSPLMVNSAVLSFYVVGDTTI